MQTQYPISCVGKIIQTMGAQLAAQSINLNGCLFTFGDVSGFLFLRAEFAEHIIFLKLNELFMR